MIFRSQEYYCTDHKSLMFVIQYSTIALIWSGWLRLSTDSYLCDVWFQSFCWIGAFVWSTVHFLLRNSLWVEKTLSFGARMSKSPEFTKLSLQTTNSFLVFCFAKKSWRLPFFKCRLLTKNSDTLWILHTSKQNTEFPLFPKHTNPVYFKTKRLDFRT